MEFQSHIVVTSQSMNKNLWLPPLLALFTNKKMPNLIETTLLTAFQLLSSATWVTATSTRCSSSSRTTPKSTSSARKSTEGWDSGLCLWGEPVLESTASEQVKIHLHVRFWSAFSTGR